MKQRRQSLLRALTSCLRAKCAATGLPRLRGENGAGVVEYALVFILFVTIVFGVCGFGLALYDYHFVSHAAREATRWAAVNGHACASDSSCTAPATAADIQNYVAQLAPQGINPNNLTVTASWPSTDGICATVSNDPGCAVQVQVSYSYAFILPLIGINPLNLSSTSQMIIAH